MALSPVYCGVISEYRCVWNGVGGLLKHYYYYVEPLYFGYIETRKDYPAYQDVLVSGVEGGPWQRIVNHLIPVACVHIRGVYATHGSGLEGCLQFRGLD